MYIMLYVKNNRNGVGMLLYKNKQQQTAVVAGITIGKLISTFWPILFENSVWGNTVIPMDFNEE